MTRIRLAVCAALAAATAALAGCGGESDSSGPSQPAPSDLPTVTPSGTISAKPGKLPGDFPLPKGAEKGDFTDTGGTLTGTVTVKDGSKAYDFWADELDKAGYSITSKNRVDLGGGAKGLITFSGNGYSSATITISDTNVAISLQQ